MVCIYANLEGLARKLASCGIIHAPADMHAFARSFSLNQPLFNFIDVGVGKERADHKLKGKSATPHVARLAFRLHPSSAADTYAQKCFESSFPIYNASTYFLAAATTMVIYPTWILTSMIQAQGLALAC